jgi:hypothetical protein
MNAYEPRPLSAETAELLLDGHPVAARHAQRLAQRLAAASAPGFPGELAGEAAATNAFLAAVGTNPALSPGRRTMTKSAVVAKLLTLKAAAVAVAAVSAGGVALAASTNVLPNPFAPANPAHSTPAPGGPTNRPDATPSPSLVGLCTAYLAGAGADHGKALESPAFSALITAAGGKDNVDAYCAGRGVTAPGSTHSTSEPSEHPTGQPTTHPGPSEHPTGEPSHPTGEPTTHPAP